MFFALVQYKLFGFDDEKIVKPVVSAGGIFDNTV